MIRHRRHLDVAGGIVSSDGEAWAGWRLAARSTTLLTVELAVGLRNQVLVALAALGNVDCHLIVDAQTFRAAEWADGLRATTDRPAEGFAGYLGLQERALVAASGWAPQATLFVRVDEPTVRSRVEGLFGVADMVAQRARWERRAAELGAALTSSRLRVRPVDEVDVAELVESWEARGGARRAPVAGGRLVADLDQEVRLRSIRTVAAHAEDPSAWTAWSALDVVPERMMFPGKAEFLNLADLGFPVQVWMRWTQEDADALKHAAVRAMNSAVDQADNTAGTAVSAPKEMQKAHRQLAQIVAETDANEHLPSVVGLRVACAVHAAGQAELADRVAKLHTRFRNAGMLLRTPAGGQLAYDRAWLPCTPTPKDPYTHRAPLVTVAGAGFLSTDEIGNRAGLYVGYTRTGKPTFLDTHEPIRVRDIPAGWLITGQSGWAGKTTTAALLALHSAYQGGAWLIVDPSSRLGALERLAPGVGPVTVQQIGPDSDAVGAFDPYLRSGSPVEAADAASSVVQLLLRPRVADRWETEIEAACQKVAGGPHAPTLAAVPPLLPEEPREALQVAARSYLGRLLFAPPSSHAWTPSPGVTVLQVQGMNAALPPKGVPRGEQSTQQRAATAALYAIAQSCRRMMVSPDLAGIAKGAVLDEAHHLTGTEHGARLVAELVRDGRKHDMAVLLASQLAGDVADQVHSNVVMRLSGRATFPAEIRRVLDSHGLAYSQATHDLVAGLRPHEYLFSDGEGYGVVTVDLLSARISEVLSTSPGRVGR